MNYKGTTHIKLEDRRTIEKMLKIKTPVAKIAEALGKCRKTIYNEIARGLCVQQTSEYEFVERYCADVAERKYQEHLREKGPEIKVGHDYDFVEYIEDQIINKKRSPGAALAQIQIDGKKFDTEICENTLYNWIYRGDVFLNVTEADLLYKGKRRNEGKKSGTPRAGPDRQRGKPSNTARRKSTAGKLSETGKWTVLLGARAARPPWWC